VLHRPVETTRVERTCRSSGATSVFDPKATSEEVARQ
jgi:hypothetical protein